MPQLQRGAQFCSTTHLSMLRTLWDRALRGLVVRARPALAWASRLCGGEEHGELAYHCSSGCARPLGPSPVWWTSVGGIGPVNIEVVHLACAPLARLNCEGTVMPVGTNWRVGAAEVASSPAPSELPALHLKVTV